MKILFIFGLVSTFAVISANLCKDVPVEVPSVWATMVKNCTGLIKGQIKKEISAAMTYMAMGSHFSRDTINRPGFAKLFFNAASEEREHAIKLIEYLLLRGDLFKDLNTLIDGIPKPAKTYWTSGYEALTDAVYLESNVTQLIVSVVKACDTPANKKKDTSDYHAVDYLIEEFLGEQYRGQRDLAGKASTLGKMTKTDSSLAEFLFDKKLLHGEL